MGIRAHTRMRRHINTSILRYGRYAVTTLKYMYKFVTASLQGVTCEGRYAKTLTLSTLATGGRLPIFQSTR